MKMLSGQDVTTPLFLSGMSDSSIQYAISLLDNFTLVLNGRLLKFDSSFLQFLMRNRWKSKTQSNEEQKESRQKDVEQQAAKKLEEFYKNREPAPEKEKKKSKKPAPKTKKKEVAPTQEDNTQTEQEREQMEKEDQLARQLVAREFYLKKRFAPYAHGIEDEQGIPLDCAGQQ